MLRSRTKGGSKKAIAELNLTAGEQLEVNAVFSRAFDDAEKSLLERVESVPSSKEGVYNFRFQADPLGSKTRMAQLTSELAKSLGTSRGAKLVNMIPLHAFLGGMGYYDARISIVPDDSAESTGNITYSGTAIVKLFHPDSGSELLLEDSEYRRMQNSFLKALRPQ